MTKEQERVRLSGISSRAFEHPADGAAMAALRKVPGLDALIRKMVGFIGEKSLRFVYLGSAVRVTETQFSRLNEIFDECLEVLDIEQRPELFVSQTPFVNAGAAGVDKPFIVVNSATLGLLDDEGYRFILGHELGHIICDHVLYKTMLSILLSISLGRFGIPLGGLAISAIIAALSEWDRKSELSCDRAGLLCLQDPWSAYTVFMKMAGGKKVDQMDINEFVQQAKEYEEGGNELDSILKLLNLSGRRHPFGVLRLAELKRWVERGEYQRIVDGDYAQRTDEDDSSVYDDVSDGARAYKESYQQSKDPFVKFVREMSTQGAEVGGQIIDKIKDIFGGKKDEEASENGDAGDDAPTADEPAQLDD